MNKIFNNGQILRAFFVAAVILLGERVLELTGILNSSSSFAYELGTHQFIVEDAITFMVDEEDQSHKSSSHISDFHLLKKVLAPTKTDSAPKSETIPLIVNSSRVLAEASRDTDKMQDIWLEFAFSKNSKNAGVSYTVFSHFLNIRGPRSLYPEEGYHFGWVKENSSCPEERNTDDLFANIFVDWFAGEFDIKKSDAYKRYKEPRLEGVTESELENNFSQDIEHIHFWPITNLATYWYKEFQNSRRAPNSKPLNLPHLGPVLHAAADTTVPFHAAGLSGCGHGIFEESVEGFYKSRSFYDPEIVKNHLKTKSYLKTDSTIKEILVENAVQASSNCTCSVTSCDCRQVLRNTKAMKDLVNLAIASTVIVIRKGFNEWLQSNPILTIQTSLPWEFRENFPATTFYDSWDSTPITSETMGYSGNDIWEPTNFQLNRHLYNLKMSAGNYVDNTLTKEQFNEKNQNSSEYFWNFSVPSSAPVWSDNPVDTLEETPGVIKYAGMPPILPDNNLIRFRPPNLEEIKNDQKWGKYLEARNKFYKKKRVLDLAFQVFNLKTKVRESKDEEEKNKIRKTIMKIQNSSDGKSNTYSE